MPRDKAKAAREEVSSSLSDPSQTAKSHNPSAGRDEASFEAERSFVRAPLNSRVVSGGVLRDKGKGKAKDSSLYGVPVEIQEALVLEDLLFVLMVCDLLPRPPQLFFGTNASSRHHELRARRPCR